MSSKKELTGEQKALRRCLKSLLDGKIERPKDPLGWLVSRKPSLVKEQWFIENFMASLYRREEHIAFWRWVLQEIGDDPLPPITIRDKADYADLYKGRRFNADVEKAKAGNFSCLLCLLEFDKSFLLVGWFQYRFIQSLNQANRKQALKIGEALAGGKKQLRSDRGLNKALKALSRYYDFKNPKVREYLAELLIQIFPSKKASFLNEDKEFVRYLERHQII